MIEWSRSGEENARFAWVEALEREGFGYEGSLTVNLSKVNQLQYLREKVDVCARQRAMIVRICGEGWNRTPSVQP